MKPGDKALWSYVPRGGYGWVIPIPAEVVKVNTKTVRIRVKRIDGVMVERNVKPENITVKNQPTGERRNAHRKP